MGLDMYLDKKSYVKNWSHMTKEEKTEVTVKKHEQETAIKSERVKYIIEEVAYWRKANQIHKWFVDNVQNGIDDCGTYDVSKEDLQKLVDVASLVIEKSVLVKGKVKNGQNMIDGELQDVWEDGEYIKNPRVAMKMLPVQMGFFFGSNQYNKYYLDDVIYTRDTIAELLKEEGQYYQYHSSW